jgi:hypothetical protein
MTLAAFFTLFGPYIVALAALAGTIYNIRSQQSKNRADTADRLASATSTTIDDLNEELSRVNLKMAAQMLQLQDLRVSAKRSLELTARLLQGITVLLNQMHAAGLAPEWQPDPEIDKLVKLCTADSDRINKP